LPEHAHAKQLHLQQHAQRQHEELQVLIACQTHLTADTPCCCR
jgi:hypothetical protein